MAGSRSHTPCKSSRIFRFLSVLAFTLVRFLAVLARKLRARNLKPSSWFLAIRCTSTEVVVVGLRSRSGLGRAVVVAVMLLLREPSSNELLPLCGLRPPR